MSLLKCLLTFLFIPCIFLARVQAQGIVNFIYNSRMKGISRLEKDIIFESNVLSWLDCGTSCLETRFCVAFNYKENSKENEINCQITHTTHHVFEKVSHEENDWTFYEAPEERMFECEEENECQNGGKMTWDPIKPFKCECPEDYFGKLCELKEDASCTTLKAKQRSLSNGNYSIIPRGAAYPPFSVYCDMTAKNGIGVTIIGHDSENRTKVNGYESPGSYRRNITYDLSMENIVAIINNSKHCQQYIKYECHYSHLLNGPRGWWVSRQGEKMNYWGGAAINSGKCACGMTNTCEKGNKKCNCDAILTELREDSGYLSDTNTLPVTELRFGDTGTPNEYGFHTLGKLQCWG